MKAERCQNFVIKVISDGHLKKCDSVTPLRKALNMLTFEKCCYTSYSQAYNYNRIMVAINNNTWNLAWQDL